MKNCYIYLLLFIFFLLNSCNYVNGESPEYTGSDSIKNENVSINFPIARIVDMGTSVHWASHNIGDTTEYTAIFKCGWGDSTGTLAQDLSLDYFPCPFPPANIANSPYDIASQQWGKKWRLPIKDDFVELWNSSEIVIGEVYGVTYYKFTSKKTGNVLYFPLESEKDIPCYWTAQLYDNDTRCAISLFLDSKVSNPIYSWVYTPRNKLCYVRPVYEYTLIWTNSSDMITGKSAQLNGTLSWTATQHVDSVGFYLSDSKLEVENPTSQTMHIGAKQVGKCISATIDDLLRDHTYYYRAYAIIDNEIHLGKISSFTTLNAYEIGDFYPDDDKPIGVVCMIENNGMKGKIVSLDQTMLAWQAGFPSYVSANDAHDGANNQLPRGSAFATWIYSHGSDWYCPARYELTNLGKSVQEINTALEKVGAQPINNFYWSSTQYSAEYYDLAYMVVVTSQGTFDGYNNGWSSYNSKSQVRGVLAMRKF